MTAKRIFTDPELILRTFAAQDEILESNGIGGEEWSGELGDREPDDY